MELAAAASVVVHAAVHAVDLAAAARGVAEVGAEGDFDSMEKGASQSRSFFHCYSSVTQPSEADFTFLMYLYNVPREAL